MVNSNQEAEQIGAEIKAFLSISNASTQSSSKTKGTSFCKRLVRGLEIFLEVFNEPPIKTGMTKETSYTFNVL